MKFSENKISGLDDRELLELYISTGDKEYFGELYNRYVPMLYGVSLKYMKQPEAAEDAVMSLFEALLPKINNYEIKVFRTWIYSVIKNHCLQLLRKEKPIVKVVINDNIMESGDTVHLFDEEASSHNEAVLKDCMERLPEKQRVAVIMFFMEDLSYTDIVDRSGYQLKAVKSYIQNGKRNLRICIEKKSGK